MSEKRESRPARRRVHLDFHTPDFVDQVGEHFDAEAFAETLARCGVDQAAFFAKCHYGSAYYPTAVGRPHPGLKRDMLGEFVAAATRRDIRTFAYYSLGFDYWYATENPDTLQRREPFFDSLCCGKWKAVCVSGPYGRYAWEQLSEIVKRYAVAGIWLDIVGYYPVCVCPCCREAFVDATGEALPFDDDRPADGIGSAYVSWQRGMLDAYTTKLAERIESIRPGCDLLCNTSTGIVEKASGLRNQADGQWCEEAACFNPVTLTGISLYPALFDSAVNPRPFEILTQRFHHGWGDWTLRSAAAMKFDVATTLAHGGLPSIGDQLYGDGSHEPVVYQRIAEVYGWLRPRQEFCGDSRCASEVAVFAARGRSGEGPGGIGYQAEACRFGEGLYKTLIDSQCPAAALPDVSAAGGRRVLLVDENLPDTAEAQQALTAFVESGGQLLAIGVGPRRYWPLLGIEGSEPLPGPVCYLRLCEPPTAELAAPLLSRMSGRRVELTGAAEILAQFSEPLCGPGERFYSHQHAPAGPRTDMPAIWRLGRGKGRVIAVATPLATDYHRTAYQPLRMLIMHLLDDALDGRRQIYATGLSPAAEVVLRRRAGAMFVHIISPGLSRPGPTGGATFDLCEPPVTTNATISLRLEDGQRCRGADQLGRTLQVIEGKQPGYVKTSLAPFGIHTVVRFDLDDEATL